MRTRLSAALAAAALFAAVPALARGEVLGFGVKAGVVFANVFGRDVFDQRFRAGLTDGIFLTFGLGGSLAVQPELLFVMKGSRYVNGQGADAYRETMSLEYVEAPILVKLYLPVLRRLRAHVFAGPAPAVNIRARVETRFAGEVQEESLDDLMGVDLGFAAGAGLEIPSGRGRVTVDLRYTAGLTTLSKRPDDHIRNGALSLFVGYMF